MILAFDTSEKKSSVALVDGDQTVCETDSIRWPQQFSDLQTADLSGDPNNDRASRPRAADQSTAIVAMIKSALQHAKLQPTEISAIAMSNGPGNFTGLRVGVVVARMLCYAWHKPLIVLDSLEVAAAKLSRDRKLNAGHEIWAAVNGQRKQLFAAKYRVQQSDPNSDLFTLDVTQPQQLLHHADWIDQLQPNDHVTGTGTLILAGRISEKIAAPLPTPELACCDAIGIALLAEPRLTQQQFDDLWKVTPVYFRPSAAEEVRAAAQP